ncbi:BREX-5 system adenine-specific DNA-methyltransferase PglX [Halomicroarcula sp. S1AR25-4]|uniref:BREX-5 system adenine-specific DNA-methyltransferase PglX n=1 Tax=Haloarcula sp. S1AR25-4 TaxID=2950538 RepID=UPI002874A0EA|nr:BREX-5 system adenine-specific DNA-methyltransferase PglX [Halomicroarcula sp. S1AR25-4]MDS0279649.1 BREX-5 system adenine-specific DNA-methyltransferase PglX [Halomicroarcula sp. S1AR25-4]
MAKNSLSHQKAQLDKAEREHLEDVVENLRSRIEDNVRFQLTQKGLADEPEDRDSLDEDIEQLVEAIDLEGVDGHTWEEAFEKYIAGVGYTIVNRLAALRCMEVRDFTDEEVTVFKENGLTPAAETLVHEEFLLEDEAILAAYHNTCDELADEIEILFDRSSTYSLIDPDDDTFEELCGMLDEIPDEVWRADDILGWVYEYYNRPVVEELDAKNTLEPEDVGPANQFYTPHWVVRMLTDNSLGKLYLEATDQEDAIPEPDALSPEERKNRLVTPTDAPTVPELCTYLIPDEEGGDAPDFDHPRELRVIDPACGSGHFLLYAFDILERIWWAETDLDRSKIPAKVLEHNLYGVDIDLRSCQLSAFNLYLKARTRTEAEDGQFEMPNVGIVCADARVAEVEEGTEVLDEITGEGSDLREAIDDVIETFQHTEGLGSLLDVSGTLEEAFDATKTQTELSDYNGDAHQSLNSFLKALRRAVEDQTSDSFGEQNLRSFLHLLVVLTQKYEVSLMNPPYGSGGRMPDAVQDYVSDTYNYKEEYYINFFEACDRRTRANGRTGMLVPRSFMFLKTFEDFREDFIGGQGAFDFLAEYGIDILDNATVRTAGTVVRSGVSGNSEGTFLRLEDVEKGNKEHAFLKHSFSVSEKESTKRLYTRDVSEFGLIPGKPLSYWVPRKLRELYDSDSVLDEDNAGLPSRNGIGDIKQGLATADDGRFLRNFWETTETDSWVPFAKGGVDSWLLPRVIKTLYWNSDGTEIDRFVNSYPRNTDYYFSEGVTFNRVKTSGRRFGYLQEGSIFADKGPTIFPSVSSWRLISYTNSRLFTYLMLAQTTERMWEVGQVSKVPWREELESIDALERLSKRAVGHLVSKRQYDFVSPHYSGPVLLDVLGEKNVLNLHEHPHRELRDELTLDSPSSTADAEATLSELGTAAATQLERIEANLQSCAEKMDEAVFDCFDISEDQRETVLQEIALRTNEDPRKQEEYDPESITEPGENFPEQVKDLVLHFALRAVNEADDGIIPVSDVEGEKDLLDHIEAEFERVWGDHADARLAEVDNVLGTKSAAEEAYPNLREWLEKDLFDYHVSKFDRTPVLWRFTTERLVPDPEGEGFGCLVDYHQLDDGVFDRLQNHYLEPRKNILRERRSAANRRRSDDSLSTSEQAEAAEEYARCESGLEQIEVFEERLSKLAQPNDREWSAEQQEAANAAASRVAEFRERTEERLEAVDELASMEDIDMGELFTGNFYEKIENQRGEWIGALEDLEAAFDAYAADPDQAVAAHLYDLFDYYTDDLLGSSHFASNGILYMTYYFDNFEQADQARLDDAGISRRQRLISQLASDLDAYTELGKSISEDCQEISSDISSDWADRALSEITTAGYQPNHKHGVEINITPLSDAEIVPKTVDNEVL